MCLLICGGVNANEHVSAILLSALHLCIAATDDVARLACLPAKETNTR